MKNIFEMIKKLSLPMRIQLGIALFCTASIPAFAWFAFQNKIEAMSKIKEPPSINLASGGDDPALYISLENIDVSRGTEKFVVFSVEPGKYSAYDIQLTHTTNIPFTYELYRVKENENGNIEYTDHTRNSDSETVLHYGVMTNITDAITTSGRIILTDVNPDASGSRIIGNENTLAANRRNYDITKDNVNQYVKPLYSIARQIPQLTENEDGSKTRDYFAIKLKWSVNSNITIGDGEYWDYAFNNKETDIIYISAKQNAYTDDDAPSP